MLGRDGWAGLVCLAGSLGLLALTRGLPQAALVPVGPGFYPRIVLGCTAVLSAVLVIADLVGQRRPAALRPPRAVTIRNRGLVATTFGAFVAYVLLLPLLGFRVATFLFVAGLQTALTPASQRRWLLIAAVAAATAVLSHLAFEGYLSVLLPRGRLTGF